MTTATSFPQPKTLIKRKCEWALKIDPGKTIEIDTLKKSVIVASKTPETY